MAHLLIWTLLLVTILLWLLAAFVVVGQASSTGRGRLAAGRPVEGD